MKIEFQNLSKRYGRKYALRDFTAELTGSVYGLLGANGAGKTTLINILVGILKKDGGEVLVDGKRADTLGREFLAKIGYMPQYPLFYKDFTVREFLAYMSALKGISAAKGKGRASELLEIVNLADAADKRIGALSGGMRQRVGIVQAMLGDPEILILDEPTAGLDPHERIRFRNLITQFSEGRIVLLATHIVPDVECIAREVIIVKEGRLLRQDSPAALAGQLSGKVWTVMAQDGESHEQFLGHPISNMQRVENGVCLRVLANERPSPDAMEAVPSLEDVFLYSLEGNRV
ncbi:MAG: ABC transporter ATP-binding protein [Oscillospiraceae bacterium]|jgi:ABC-2 type transport system ATP-binding protein|nr:ABC transporter ATP-binding protein [Oscillospiraceae bacterium]